MKLEITNPQLMDRQKLFSFGWKSKDGVLKKKKKNIPPVVWLVTMTEILKRWSKSRVYNLLQSDNETLL